MSIILKQSTQIKVRIGPFVDVGDGFTPETGITLGAADEAELLKANGAATVDISGATWAAVTGADGWYDLTLTTSHTDTVGELLVIIQDDSVCLPVYQRFQVVEEAIYDALYAASANAFTGAAGSTTLTALASGSITAAVIATGAIDADAIASDAITDAKVASDVTIASVTGAVGSVTGAVGSVTGAVGSVTGNVGGNVTGSVGSIATGGIAAASFAAGAITAAAIATDAIDADALAADAVTEIQSGLATASTLSTIAGYLDTEIAAILADTNELQTDWANGGRLDLLIDAILDDTGTAGVVVNDFTTAAKALLQTEANDALVANNLDHLLLSAVDTNFATTVHLNSVIGHLADAGTTATFDRTTDALEVLGASVAPTANAVADALLDRADAIETGITPRLAFRYIAAACCGKLSGAGTATEVFDGIGVNTDRITATCDSSGNRTAVTLG